MQNTNTLNEKSKRRKALKAASIYIFLIVASIIVLYPLIYLVMNSFKTGIEINQYPRALPKSLSFIGYIDVFKALNIPRLFLNTMFIAGSVTVLNVIFSSMVAYGIVKCNLGHQKLFTNIILGFMMVPGILLTIPTYMMVYNWNWINTYKVMIIPFCLGAYNIFLMIQFMKQIDTAYLEAARIDGANEFLVFWKVVLPMARPALATISILTFMGAWNDFFNALLYLRDDSHMTIQLGVWHFNKAIALVDQQQLYAAMVIVVVPVVIIFFFLQENFTKAFTGVGLK